MFTGAEWTAIGTTAGGAISAIGVAWRWAVKNAQKRRDDIIDANVDLRKELRDRNIELVTENEQLYEDKRALQKERDKLETDLARAKRQIEDLTPK